jgi:repressor LexA
VVDELSDRQSQILAFISRHCRDTGYPPTVREIGLAVGLASPSTVHAHLAKLEAAGHIRRDPTKPRAMEVRGEGQARQDAAPPRTRVEALPLVGSVAAGAPVLAEEHVEDWVTSPFEGDFVLTVRGDSMTGAGILDGDMVVVRRRQTADEGEIVVAQIEDEATVKRLRRMDGKICLMPENDAYEPIVPEQVHLHGVVVGVMRRL